MYTNYGLDMHSKKNIFKATLGLKIPNSNLKCAEVAELVDALGSGSSGSIPVGVRVSPSAPQIINTKSAVSILRFFSFVIASLGGPAMTWAGKRFITVCNTKWPF